MPVRVPIECIAFLIARLTGPAGGQDRDRIAGEIIAESAVGRGTTGLMMHASRLWTSSATYEYVMRIMRPILQATPAERLRLGGVTTVVASVTALVARYAASPQSPMTWMVPLAAGICGAGVIVSAPAIVTAWSQRNLQRKH